MSALHDAAAAGDAHALRQAVLDGEDLDALNERGLTPAHVALGHAYRFDHARDTWEVSQGHKDALDALVAAGANLDTPSRAGMTVRQQANAMGVPALDAAGPSNAQVAGSFELWRQHADPDGWITRADFDAMPEAERLDLVAQARAPEAGRKPPGALEARVAVLEQRVAHLQAENARLLKQRQRLKDAVGDLLHDEPAPKSGQKTRLRP